MNYDLTKDCGCGNGALCPVGPLVSVQDAPISRQERIALLSEIMRRLDVRIAEIEETAAASA